MATPINSRQNEPALQALLRADAVAHGRAQRLDSLRLLLSTMVAGLGLVATLVPAAAAAATIVGALWAMAYAIRLGPWGGDQLRRAALLQEMFDVRLFGIPWNSVVAGEQLPAHEVSRLAKRYRGGDDLMIDYYEIPELPPPYDILACQQQNLGWGARVRRRFAYSAVAAVGIWTVTGLVVGVVAGLTVAEVLLRWYIPSLGFFLLGLDTFRGQLRVATDREWVLSIVRARIATAAANPDQTAAAGELRQLARQVQDQLFLTRLRVPRVPDWFFLRYRAGDRADFRAAMQELTELLARNALATRR